MAFFKRNQVEEQNKSKTPQKKKSAAREWFDSILFAVIAASLIRWLLFEPFQIPTSSMENSLLVGDFLFVSKIHYGAEPQKRLFKFHLLIKPFGEQSRQSLI